MSESAYQRRDRWIDSVRLSDREHQELLDRLRDEEAGRGGRERRVEERLDYRVAGGLIVQVSHPGGSVVNYLVRTRNLSKTGMAFLHGGYLHQGTPCVITLRRLDGRITTVQGKVRRCRLVTGCIHEVGIRFNATIDLTQYLANQAPGGTLEAALAAPAAPPPIRARVLYVEDSLNDQELMKFQLQDLGVQVTSVANGMDAMAPALSGTLDMVITGVWLPGMTGSELALALREQGFKGPILALTADPRPHTREQALQWGCTAVLSKPYHLEDLIALLHQHLRPAQTPPPNPRVLTSDYWLRTAMRPLIIGYLERLEPEIETLGQRLKENAPEQLLQKLCLDIKGSAGGYGYPSLSRQAHQLFDLLLQHAPAEQVQTAYQQLADLSRQAVAVLSHPQAA